MIPTPVRERPSRARIGVAIHEAAFNGEVAFRQQGGEFRSHIRDLPPIGQRFASIRTYKAKLPAV